MALIDLYNRSIFKKLKTTDSPDFPTPTATPATNPPLGQSTVAKMAADYYENAPILQSTYLGSSAQPLVTIKPNESADQYSNRLNYTLTRAGAAANWLLSPEGLKFSLLQTAGQTFNPQIETKIWKPNSVLSNLIPLTGYHERRHMSLSSLLGIPGLSIVTGASPASYTEALFASDAKSRIVYQSPAISIPDKESVGINYANVGRDVMTLAKTWQSLNPNRYSYPIGADGGGLPNSNVITPLDEMNVNIGLATQGWRYTKATGYNPVLDAQITLNKQFSGTSFLQKLLKSIPFVNTIMAIFGYGILGASAPKIKIYNKYNPTFPYSRKRGKQIRVVDDDGELLDTYDLSQDTQTPLERILYAIEKATTIANEKPQTGVTFVSSKAAIQPDFQRFEEASARDSRLLKNPQDGTANLNQYLQTYGDIAIKRAGDKQGTLNINAIADPLNDKKTYSKYLAEETSARLILSPKGRAFAWSGAGNDSDREGDALNLLPYGEDSEGKNYEDLIPFKFYHVNEKKWIVFRASLTGITDSVSPEWNEKSYIGRADKLYIYKGATRKINFQFTLMVYNPKELQPVYEKLNYLMGLCYPTYKNLSKGYGKYMEAPFVQLTIGDLFSNVYGILDGGVTVTFDDDATWEIRDEQPQGRFDIEKINIAKLPRLIRVNIGSFTPFSLNNRPISATSPFFSAIKKWQEEGTNPSNTGNF